MPTATAIAGPPAGYHCPCSLDTPAGSLAHARKCCCPPGCLCDKAARIGIHIRTDRERQIARAAYAAGFVSAAAGAAAF